MNGLNVWLEATRPKTLPAAVCPVLVGTSLAYEQEMFDWRAASICLFFALLVQIGTNFANDYLDGIKGTDTKARMGPTRAVASGLIAPEKMKSVAVITLLAAFCLGLLLIPFGGWWLLLVGIASVLCAWLYTGGPYPLAYNGLGDVFVILFFGFVAVGCSYFVQAGGVSSSVLLSGLACGLLINNLLVINNYRDSDEDEKANKRTLVVLLGRGFALWQFRLSVLVVAGITTYLAFTELDPPLLVALSALFPSALLSVSLPKLKTPKEYLSALKVAGLSVAIYGFLFTAAVVLY